MGSKRSDPTKKPVERAMSRSDSLSSMGEFGAIVPLSKQPALREQKKKPKMGPFNLLMNALSGGKK